MAKAIREEIEKERLQKIAQKYNVGIDQVRAVLYAGLGKERWSTEECIRELLKKEKLISADLEPRQIMVETRSYQIT